MKYLINILCFLIFSIPQNSSGYNRTEALKVYHEANIAYQKLDYDKCISLYEQLIKNNSVAEEVYFNLGNAYFKKGNTAKAILNYERARKLEPEDEDVNFNLKIASLKVVDKIESVPEVFYKKWISSVSSIFPESTWSVITILFIWLLFISLALYVTSLTVNIKKIFFVFAGVLFILTITSGILTAHSYAITNLDEQAIIISSSVYVKSSPDEKGNDLFILHEGTKVDVLDKLNEWMKIRIANGGIGWLKSLEMEKI
jgi:tetratricopeptide (TPR) repeat protein